MLPGLARLLDTGRRYALNLKDQSAGHAPPRVGELPCGTSIAPIPVDRHIGTSADDMSILEVMAYYLVTGTCPPQGSKDTLHFSLGKGSCFWCCSDSAGSLWFY